MLDQEGWGIDLPAGDPRFDFQRIDHFLAPVVVVGHDEQLLALRGQRGCPLSDVLDFLA